MQSKLVKIGTPDLIWIETEEKTTAIPTVKGSTSARIDDVEVSWREADSDIRSDSEEKKLEVYVQSQISRIKFVKLRWQRSAPRKVQILGDAWERGYGDLQWMGLSSRRTMPWYFMAATEEKIAGYGVMVRPSAMCFWQMDTQGITLVLDVRCGGSGVDLNGRKLHAATVIAMESERGISQESPGISAPEMSQGSIHEKVGRVVQKTESTAMCEYSHGAATFQAAQDFCRMMCTDPIFPAKPVYGSNNWYYAYGESSEEEILADTDYLMTLMEGAANPPYMVIDDCWQEHRRPEYIGGPWKKGNAKFPDMKKLAEQIAAKGAIPGIWVRFLLNIDPEIPDSWRFDGAGCANGTDSANGLDSTNGPDSSNEPIAIERPEGVLDPSVPEVLEYIKQDIRRICGEWGYRLIKHDFSTFDIFARWGMEMKPSVTPDGWRFHDATRTSAEIVKDLYTAIYEAASETNTIIIGCNTIGHLGAGLMHVNRTGDDTSGLHWERTRQMGINTLAFRLPQHRAFYDVDADCVGITGQVPWFYNRQWADVIAESGTPLFVSAKPGVLNDEEKEQLHQIMCKASEQKHHKIPLDWEENDTPEIWGESWMGEGCTGNSLQDDVRGEDRGITGDRETGECRSEDIIHYIWYRPEDDIPRSRDGKYCIQLPL